MDVQKMDKFYSLKLVAYKSVHFLFEKFIKPESRNEDLERREFIFNILSICTIFLFAIASIINVAQLFTTDPDLYNKSTIPLPIMLAMLFIFLILHYLSRKGKFTLSAYLFIAICFLFPTYVAYRWGAELSTVPLLYVLVILISGILIHTRFAFALTLISSLTLFILSFLRLNQIITPILHWKNTPFELGEVFVLSIILLIIAIVSWLSNREIEKSLRRARKSEAELKKERDTLEIRVKERTQELQKTQMEKMTQVYKFAEFGRLSSGFFHDLINPLNAVFLNVEKMRKEHQTNKKIKGVKEDLKRTMKATERMKYFIHSINKQISHEETLKLFSINQEIKEAIEVLKYRTRKNNVKISFNHEQKIKAFSSPPKFNQVMVNLINNAIDAYSDIASDQDKEIEINLVTEKDVIIINVNDRGSGIKENIIDKIFEPFFTTKNFKQDKDSGIGIGLALVKRIVEKDFKGEVKAENRKNGGAKFTVKFPIITKNYDHIPN